MIRPWSPLGEISRLEKSISSLFDDLWREFTPRTLAEVEMGSFPVDVVDEGDTILVRAEPVSYTHLDRVFVFTLEADAYCF